MNGSGRTFVNIQYNAATKAAYPATRQREIRRADCFLRGELSGVRFCFIGNTSFFRECLDGAFYPCDGL